MPLPGKWLKPGLEPGLDCRKCAEVAFVPHAGKAPSESGAPAVRCMLALRGQGRRLCRNFRQGSCVGCWVQGAGPFLPCSGFRVWRTFQLRDRLAVGGRERHVLRPAHGRVPFLSEVLFAVPAIRGIPPIPPAARRAHRSWLRGASLGTRTLRVVGRGMFGCRLGMEILHQVSSVVIFLCSRWFQGSGLRIQGLGLRLQGLGFRIKDSGFRV